MATHDCRVSDEAFITLATNDFYSRGALVLAESLKKHRTTRQLVIMITPHVSPTVRSALEETFDVVRMVDVLDSRDAAHLACLKRPELGITFTKIHCWTFVEYRKCVFMDADMMVLQNIDDLFEREEFSAAPDSGWPDIFNSGLFVFRPSFETFNSLLLFAETEGSFDGGDQGLLNSYFSNWSRSDISRHLPFLYNLHVSASYQYLPAFKRFGKDTKVVHFLGPIKPWNHIYNQETGAVQETPGTSQSGVRHFPEYLNEWWRIYNEKVQRYFPKGGSLEPESQEAAVVPSSSVTGNNQEFSWESEGGHAHEGHPSQHEEECKRDEPNPFFWTLPETFFKTQPNYEKNPPQIHSAPNYDQEIKPQTHTAPSCEQEIKPQTHSFPSYENEVKPQTHSAPNHDQEISPQTYFAPSEKEMEPQTHSAPSHDKEMEPQTHSAPSHDRELEPQTPSEPQTHLAPSHDEETAPRSQSSSPVLMIEVTSPTTRELLHPQSAYSDQRASSPPVNHKMASESNYATLIPPSSPTEGRAKVPPLTKEEIESAKLAHMEAWQRGDVDYMGVDKFANIQAALDAFLT